MPEFMTLDGLKKEIFCDVPWKEQKCLGWIIMDHGRCPTSSNGMVREETSHGPWMWRLVTNIYPTLIVSFLQLACLVLISTSWLTKMSWIWNHYFYCLWNVGEFASKLKLWSGGQIMCRAAGLNSPHTKKNRQNEYINIAKIPITTNICNNEMS
jgi:hypothetical protein